MPELMNNQPSHRPLYNRALGRRSSDSDLAASRGLGSPSALSLGSLPLTETPGPGVNKIVRPELSPTAELGVSALSCPDGEIGISGGTFNAVKGNQNHVTVHLHLRGIGEAGIPAEPESSAPSLLICPPDTSLETKSSSFALQPPPSQLVIPEQNINDVYYRLLSSKRRGSPLWIPGTNKRLPIEYQRNGLEIGDVGIITERGFFDSLFNIVLPRDHPLAINSDRLPGDFCPLNIMPTDINEFSDFMQGSYLSSASIKNSYKDDNSSGLIFESSASEGAILTLPDGSNSEDLENKKSLRRYLSVHGEEMYRCALDQHGRIIKNGDLRVVTGYNKTTSWGMAAFSNSMDGSDFQSFRLKFRPRDTGVGGRTHSWESSGSAEVKAGPDMRELMLEPGPGDVELDKESSSNHPFSNSTEGSQPRGHSSYSSQFSSTLESYSGPSGGPRSTYNSTLSNTLAVHPSNGINGILLKLNPHARMAITGDEFWISVLTEEDSVLPPVEQLWARIEESFVVCEEDGVVFLEKRNIETIAPRTGISPLTEYPSIDPINDTNTKHPTSTQTKLRTEVIFSSDVTNMDEWSQRIHIPLITADTLGERYTRAHLWFRKLEQVLIREHHWTEVPSLDQRMLFSLESSSTWRSSVDLPPGSKFKLQLPVHVSTFFSPERKIQWQMVFSTDVFENVRKICPPVNDILNLIQCLLTGLVTLVFEERFKNSIYRTTRGLPPLSWVNANEPRLIVVFGSSHLKALKKACGDTEHAHKLEIIPQ